MCKTMSCTPDPIFVRLTNGLLNPFVGRSRARSALFIRFFVLLPVLLSLFLIGVQSAMAQPGVDNLRALNQAGNVATPYVKINFQPANAAIPAGYLPDNGAKFGNRGNGYSYGWNTKVNQTRERNIHSDQRYDTLNHMQKGGQKYTWEIALPNGVYELFLVMGDAEFADTTNKINLEGTIINDPDGQDNFDEYQATVTVADGRLTIKPASGAKNAKIAFIDILTAGSGPTPTPTNTPPVSQAVASLTLINADTNQDIRPLVNGDTLDLSTLPQNLTIRANTNPATVGSVQFIRDNVNYRIENTAPYALDGDNAGDYFNSTFTAGSHTITAIPYTQGNAGGVAGTGMTIAYNVTTGNPSTPTPTPSTEPPPLFGSEIGINLDQFNQVKSEIAQGVYDRPCSSAEHNPTQWHLLVDPAKKCHYDHHHGDDPNYVNDILGQPGAWFARSGQSISYPWQTFKAKTADEPNDQYVANKQMENDLKHEGYFWVVRRNQACPEPYCTTDFRLQVHAVFGAMDMPVRFHSYSFEARVCRDPNNPSSCGIIRNGGWVDFGRLFTTNGVIDCGHGVNEIFINLPADTLYFPIDRPESRDEIRCHPIINNLPARSDDRPLSEWWGHSPGDRIRFQLRSFDPLGNVIPEAPDQWHLFCGLNDPNCRYSQSLMTAWIGYTLQVPEFNNGVRLDQNRDGRTEYLGYANRWGIPVSGCTQPGLDCVPNEYSNVLLNLYPDDQGIFKEARYTHHICDDCPKVDYDLAPSGQKWITWFYRHAGLMSASGYEDTMAPEQRLMETETLTPTLTPEPTSQPADPTTEPAETPEPTSEPTATPEPTPEPTAEPTEPPAPTSEPAETPDPTAEPTSEPTSEPEATTEPTTEPAATPEPTSEPPATTEAAPASDE